jgi:hypothetical protein
VAGLSGGAALSSSVVAVVFGAVVGMPPLAVPVGVEDGGVAGVEGPQNTEGRGVACGPARPEVLSSRTSRAWGTSGSGGAFGVQPIFGAVAPVFAFEQGICALQLNQEVSELTAA